MIYGEREGENGSAPGAGAWPPEEPLELLRVPEAAKRYPIGVKRLYGLIHAGEIPAIIIRNPRQDRILVRPQAVEAWFLEQERRQRRVR